MSHVSTSAYYLGRTQHCLFTAIPHFHKTWQMSCYFLICSAYFKCDSDGKCSQPGGVQWHSSSHVLCVQRHVPDLCLAEKRLCGPSQWGSTAQQWRRHSHHGQGDSLWWGAVQVQRVQWYQWWNQSPHTSEHQLWVFTEDRLYILGLLYVLKASTPKTVSLLLLHQMVQVTRQWRSCPWGTRTEQDPTSHCHAQRSPALQQWSSGWLMGCP